MYKMIENIEREIEKIADKGLTTANLETAYKLIDMYKDLKCTEMYDKESEYYESSGYNDYSNRSRRRNGRYSRNDGYSRNDNYSRNDGYSSEDGYYNRYMDSKQSYRSERTSDGKNRLIESLEDYMDDFTNKIREMHRDADTQEEREMISKFMSKLQNIR